MQIFIDKNKEEGELSDCSADDREVFPNEIVTKASGSNVMVGDGVRGVRPDAEELGCVSVDSNQDSEGESAEDNFIDALSLLDTQCPKDKCVLIDSGDDEFKYSRQGRYKNDSFIINTVCNYYYYYYYFFFSNSTELRRL